MDVVNLIAGPLIGAVIGYFTNLIAVKMLFRPLHPVKIKGFQLPFTPGIIPKGRERLARALGVAVGENLLTKEDLEQIFVSGPVRQVVVDALLGVLCSVEKQRSSVKGLLMAHMPEERYESEKQRLENVLCEKFQTGLASMDITALINEESKRVIKEKLHGTLFEKMISDDLIEGMTSHIGVYVERYVQENGRELLLPVIDGQVTDLEEKSLQELMEVTGATPEKIRDVIERVYMEIVQERVSELAERFPIREMVEEKVLQMDVLEIEELVLSVMRKELDTIVNLGALIGFVIGIVNIFF